MKPRIILTALVFAIAMLVLSAFDAWRQATTATTWTVPIEGYDPRDLIRGHYVTFRYVIPVTESSSVTEGMRLCFSGTTAETKVAFFEAATITPWDDTPRRPSPSCAATGRMITGHDGLTFDWAGGALLPTATGILYIPEEHSEALTKLLLDDAASRAVLVQVALNGKVTPVDILINGRPYRDLLSK